MKSADGLVGDKNRALYALWMRLKGQRLAPKRDEFTLALVGKLSSWIWTVDVVGDDFRFRIAGDRIIQFLEKGHGDLALSKAPETEFFNRVRRIFQHCVAEKTPAAYGPTRSVHEHKEYLEVEAVVLPLSDDGVNVTGLMGAMEFWPFGTMTTKA